MITSQLLIFVFLCIVLGVMEYLSDRSKEKLKSVLLLMVVITLLVVSIILDSALSYVPIGIMVLINITYIVNLGRKKKDKSVN